MSEKRKMKKLYIQILVVDRFRKKQYIHASESICFDIVKRNWYSEKYKKNTCSPLLFML